MNKDLLWLAFFSLMISIGFHGMIMPLFLHGDDKITITIHDEVDMGSRSNKEVPHDHPDHCDYDPTEHDEPHEKMIDKIFDGIKRVVKSGFGLFIVVKGTMKIIKGVFRK